MKLFWIVVFVLLVGDLFSQNYMRSAGVRGGSRPSLTYRMFMNDEDAYEFYLSVVPGGTTVSAMKQKFVPRLWGNSDNLYFGYGFGVHAGYLYTDHYKLFNTRFYFPNKRLAPLFGVDGYLGAEYRAKEFPFIFGLDATPFFEFSSFKIFQLNILNTAFTFKYRF